MQRQTDPLHCICDLSMTLPDVHENITFPAKEVLGDVNSDVK
jgi:hypothetical protein